LSNEFEGFLVDEIVLRSIKIAIAISKRLLKIRDDALEEIKA